MTPTLAQSQPLGEQNEAEETEKTKPKGNEMTCDMTYHDMMT